MKFTGFPPEAFEFYERLEGENTKPFWERNKPVWESAVRAPMDALLEQLRAEFGEAKVFRPYRDVRFSKDKSPYKNHQGGWVETKPGLGYYVQVSADGLMTAAGFYAAASDQVERYRVAILDDSAGQELAGIVAVLEKKGFEIHGDVMKTRPRGVDPDHPRLELLRHRSLTPMRMRDPGPVVESRKAFAAVRDDWRALRPLNEWVAHHVGPTRDEPRR